MLVYAKTQTRVAPLNYLVADDVVIAAGFDLSASQLLALSHEQSTIAAVPGTIAAIADAITAWNDGLCDEIRTVKVRQHQRGIYAKVWQELRSIPAGAPISYQELAQRVGQPSAVRAVASGCARNNIAFFIPCHRVIRTGGGLGGYAYGLERKQALLDHEAGLLTTSSLLS